MTLTFGSPEVKSERTALLSGDAVRPAAGLPTGEAAEATATALRPAAAAIELAEAKIDDVAGCGDSFWLVGTVGPINE